MNHRRKISRKQKRARYRNQQQALKAAKHLTLGDQHDEDRKAAEAIRLFPIVPRLRQPPFPREREFGFVGHYLRHGFVAQGAEAFVAMNVACRQDAWYWRHDKRRNRGPRREDTGMVETNVSLSSGLAQVAAKLVEAGQLELAQGLVQAAGDAGMAELKARTGYEPAYLALHPDARGTLSFHFGLWPVDREQRCLIGRSAGGKRGRRGLRELGHAFISLLRHDDAIGLPENLIRRAKQNLAERDSDDWAVAVAMDRKLRDELMELPNGKELVEQADEYQKAAAKDWLERFDTGAAGVAALKQEAEELAKALELRKLAAERLVRLKIRHSQDQLSELEAKAVTARQAADQMAEKLAAKDKAIKVALRHLGGTAEAEQLERSDSLVRRAAQFADQHDQAINLLHEVSTKLKESRASVVEAEARNAGLAGEMKWLRQIKELITAFVDQAHSKSVKFDETEARLFGQICALLGTNAESVKAAATSKAEEPRVRRFPLG